MTTIVVISADDLEALLERAVTKALSVHTAEAAAAAEALALAVVEPEQLTLREAASLMRCSVETVRRRVGAGVLDAVPGAVQGSRMFVTRASVHAALGR